MKTMRVFIWIIMCICLILTFMPYLDVFNAPVMIAGLPMPLALTLGCNLILTLCVITLYPLYFKPFMKALKNKPISEDKYNG